MKEIEDILTYEEMATLTELLSKIAVSDSNVIEYNCETGTVKFLRPIDREKLDKLAREYAQDIEFLATTTMESTKYWAYRAGYIKAKED